MERVVRPALDPDRGRRLARDVPAAERARAVRRVDRHGIGQGEQLPVEGIVELPRHVRRREALRRGREVGPADVADEEGVARQHERGSGSSTRIEMLSGVCPGVARTRSTRLPSRISSPSRTARWGMRRGLLAEDDRGARALGELAMPAHEVGVEVRLEDPSNRQPRARASAMYSSTSRRGSTTAASPPSPMRYDACARHPR